MSPLMLILYYQKKSFVIKVVSSGLHLTYIKHAETTAAQGAGTFGTHPCLWMILILA
jgi:hypothetical protein